MEPEIELRKNVKKAVVYPLSRSEIPMYCDSQLANSSLTSNSHTFAGTEQLKNNECLFNDSIAAMRASIFGGLQERGCQEFQATGFGSFSDHFAKM